MKSYKVGIIGATGLVGQTVLSVLAETNFPVKHLSLYASARSEGKIMKFKNQNTSVEPISQSALLNLDIAFFCASSSIALQYAQNAANHGVLVIDNSSAFRMDSLVPIIIPEVNLDDYQGGNLIANPNCSTIQVLLPIKAIYESFGIERIIYTTYQAVSGSGLEGINDLKQTKAGLEPSFYPHNISNTCIPSIDQAGLLDYTLEELKMVNETKKILKDPNLKITATCVRVPVENGHAVSVLVETKKPASVDQIKTAFSQIENLEIIDDLKENKYPTSMIAVNTDKVYVGRIRQDLSSEHGILFYVTADNVRKGAASNAVGTALKLIEKNII